MQRAFVKPLTGSRGDFAQAIHGEAALDRYLRRGLAILRFDVDAAGCRGEPNTGFFCSTTRSLYAARKYPPAARGDGTRPIRDLLTAHNAACNPAAFRRLPRRWSATPASIACCRTANAWEIPGRMNLSAGGTHGLRSAPFHAVLTAGEEGRPRARPSASPPSTCSRVSAAIRMRYGVIEVNSSPSIRLLEAMRPRRSDPENLASHDFPPSGLL